MEAKTVEAQGAFLDPILLSESNGVKEGRPINIPLSQILQVLQVEVKYTEVHQFQVRLFSMVGPRLLRTQD